MNSTISTASGPPPASAGGMSSLVWLFVLAAPLALAWFTGYRRIAPGEPPLVPYIVPWLGHGMAFMNDINGFTEWVRSLHPNSPAATVQVAGQHLYLIFDTKLASLIYRKSRIFMFDPFTLMAWSVIGATREDLQILEMGAQVERKTAGFIEDDGRRVLYDLHCMSGPALTGPSLDSLTALFIETICGEIDKRFPARSDAADGDSEWEELDLGEFVKTIWTRASITALFGSHIFTIWPEIERWLWEFDEHFQSLLTKMPRFVLPKAYALLDEAQEKCARWESDALDAEKKGSIDHDPAWDPYWGLRFVGERAKYLIKSGISEKARAGNTAVFLWGLNANTIPIAMQVMNQSVLNANLLADLQVEISRAQTGPVSFDMQKVTTAPKLKSVLLEALRWATASPSPRVVREDCQLGDFTLRKGSMVMVHSRTLQMDRETWQLDGDDDGDGDAGSDGDERRGAARSRPEEFWPARFLDGDEGEERNRVEENEEAESSYLDDITTTNTTTQGSSKSHGPKKYKIIEPVSGPKNKATQQRMLSMRPFGGGTTLCPGRHFATNEILGGLAALMLRLEIQLDDEALARHGRPVPKLNKQGGLFPDRGLRVRMRRRRAV
ncbi:Cholesterol 7-alpha-monooxygenase 3 [Phlyctema vagabunda]|uniref:Cholesterol 7-alpha-monooxygenase 3 n=1 Tax=Phlyctema vagabunda TaxID=108571 RepID=A0ABR4PH73_9HELO